MQQARRAIERAINEHFVETLVIAALVIISTMLAIHLITYTPERYTGFGVLNDAKEPGPFPANITCNEKLHLYTNVLNREGMSIQYMVRVIIGDSTSTVDPVNGAQGLVLERREAIVMDGQTWEQGMSLEFNNTLIGSKKIFFELWTLDTRTARYRFTQQVLHIWIEITEP
ncbi:MAG: DUF1616 domain-containing protein [Candidatus Sigynarchaeota archaeon]